VKTPTANRPLTLACTHNTHASTVNVWLEGKGVSGTVEVYYSGHREGLCANFEITLLGYAHKGSTDLYPKDSGAVSRPFFLASCERRVGHSGQPASDAAKKQIAEVLDRVFARVSADWGKALRESNERTNRENHRRSLTNKIEELRQELAVL
jgi:hypothetical protein